MADYLQNIENSVKEKISQGETNSALNLIVKFVENIVADPRAVARIFGSEILDKLCQEIGSRTLADRGYITNEKTNSESDYIVYIATELYITGGHTAVVQDFIKFQPNKKHLLLISDIFASGKNESVIDRFSSLSVEINWSPNGTYLDKLCWLQEQLILHQPNQVFLFNHHQDAIAIAAVQPNLVAQLIFYHHCDHQICLGLYLPHALHIDPHSFGYYNCRNNIGIKNNAYIPLISEDLNTRPNNMFFFADEKLRTCSSGSRNKFEQLYSYNYAEEVPKILSITGGYHIHIGHLSQNYLDTILNGLAKKGIEKNKFVYIPWVKSVWQAMHDNRVDVYIASFPIGGAKVSVEVMGSGTPMIGHQNYRSCILGGAEIIYPEAFSWGNPEELYNYLSSLNQETLIEQSIFSRHHYESYHTPKIFLECLENLRLGKETIYPSELKTYFRDDLRDYLDDNVSFKLQLERSQVQLQQTQSELERLQAQLQQTQSELERSQNTVLAMETSKFWKLRRSWFKIKQKIGCTS
jgi:hypothetical protein